MPTPRRRPWGQLWAAAPWDGKARPPEPLRIPATDAALIDTPPPLGTLSLRRRSWGRLLSGTPWAARPTAPTPSVEPTHMTMTDLLTVLPPLPVAAQPPLPTGDEDRVDFNLEPDDDASPTARLSPPKEVLS